MYEQQFNPYAANVDIVKGYLKSGKVLTLGILHLISIVLSILTAVTFSSSFNIYEYSQLLQSMGIDPSQAVTASSSPMYGVTASMIAGTVISSIFTLLAAIGFIIMFAKSRGNNPDSNPSAGVSILRVISLIGFICAIICVVFLVALFVLSYFLINELVVNSNLDSNTATVIWILCGVLILIFGFLFIFYTASCKNFYRSIKYSLNSADLHTKGSAAYGVFSIICAVFLGFSLIGSMVTMFSSSGVSSLISLLSTALSFITTIFTASFALGYNSYIKRCKYNYAAPYSAGPANVYNEPASGQPYYGAQQPYNDMYRTYNEPVQQNQQNPYNSDPAPAAPAQEQPSFCPNCGSKTEPNAPFCPNCGKKL